MGLRFWMTNMDVGFEFYRQRYINYKKKICLRFDDKEKILIRYTIPICVVSFGE